MTHFTRLLLSLCLALCAATVSADPIDRSRLDAARRFVLALGLGDLFIESFNRNYATQAENDPAKADEMRWILKKLTVTDAVDRLAPIYAEHLTAKQADELRNYYLSGPGRKVWQTYLNAIFTHVPFVPPQLTPEETGLANTFVATNAAFHTLNAAQPAINIKIERVIMAWMQEIILARQSNANRQIADVLDPASADSKATDNTPLTGPMAELLDIMRSYNERNQKSVKQFEAGVESIDLSTILKPASLTSRQGIADGRNKVDRYEALFDQRWREYNAGTDELMRSLRNIQIDQSMRDAFLFGAEKGLSRTYELALRMQENQRKLIAIFREMLTLADEKFGKIKAEDKRLIFDTAADMQTYNTLYERLQKEAAIETKINEEEQQSRESGLRMLRGEKSKKPS